MADVPPGEIQGVAAPRVRHVGDKKARPASLARIFEPKFPQLPTEIIPIIVEFSFRAY